MIMPCVTKVWFAQNNFFINQADKNSQYAT